MRRSLLFLAFFLAAPHLDAATGPAKFKSIVNILTGVSQFNSNNINPYGQVVFKSAAQGFAAAPITCVAKNMFVTMTITPSGVNATQAPTFTLYRAPATTGSPSFSSTGITCSIALGGYSCADSTHTYSLKAGDLIYFGTSTGRALGNGSQGWAITISWQCQ